MLDYCRIWHECKRTYKAKNPIVFISDANSITTFDTDAATVGGLIGLKPQNTPLRVPLHESVNVVEIVRNSNRVVVIAQVQNEPNIVEQPALF